MMMGISPLATLLTPETPAVPGAPIDGETFAAMLSGAAPSLATDSTATFATALPSKGARKTAIDPTMVSVAGLAVGLAAQPLPAAIQPTAAPAVDPQASPAAANSAQTAVFSMPVASPSGRPTQNTATQPAPLSAEEMAELAPALQLLSEQAAMTAPAFPASNEAPVAAQAATSLTPVATPDIASSTPAVPLPSGEAEAPATAQPVVTDTVSILTARDGLIAHRATLSAPVATPAPVNDRPAPRPTVSQKNAVPDALIAPATLGSPKLDQRAPASVTTNAQPALRSTVPALETDAAPAIAQTVPQAAPVRGRPAVVASPIASVPPAPRSVVATSDPDSAVPVASSPAILDRPAAVAASASGPTAPRATPTPSRPVAPASIPVQVAVVKPDALSPSPLAAQAAPEQPATPLIVADRAPQPVVDPRTAIPMMTQPSDPVAKPTARPVAPDATSPLAVETVAAPVLAMDIPAVVAPAVTIKTSVAQAPAMASVAARAQPMQAEDKAAPRTASRKADKTVASVDAPVAKADPVVAAAIAPTPVASDGTTAPNDAAGRLLVEGGADRQVELAKGNAWLDGISRDIAAIGPSSDGTLRFQAAPQQLGLVSVALKQGEDGASVSITAASEKARDMIADAKPRLIAEAQANGLRIASAQVDVAGQQTGEREQGGQPPQAHTPHQQQAATQTASNGGFAESGMGSGDGGRQSQTRSQLLSDTPMANPFRGAASADSADDAPAQDGLYA